MTIDERKRDDYWCIQGWNNTLEKLHFTADVVFFGNSITYGGQFDREFPNIKIINLGYPGDTTDGMLLRVTQIKAVHPKKVFIMAGLNGLHFQSVEVFSEKYSTLIDSIKMAVPSAEIYLQSILPVNPNKNLGKCLKNKTNKIIDCNAVIQRLSKEKNCKYIDLYSIYENNGIMPENFTIDGFHLYPSAYRLWYKELKKYIGSK